MGKPKKRKAAAPPEVEESAEESAEEAPAERSAEARLAAFGEAFLSSIEGPVRSAKKERRAAVQSPHDTVAAAASAAAGDGATGTGVAARKRRNRLRAKEKRRTEGEAARAADPLLPARLDPLAAKNATAAKVAAAVTKVAGRGNDGPLVPASAPGKAAAGVDMGAGRRPGVSAAERRRFMSGKVSDIRSKAGAGPSSKSREDGDPTDREFKNTLREVLDFVTPQLGKRERLQYEEQKIRALGGTIEKRQTMPYGLMQRVQKVREERRQVTLEEEKTLGVSTSVNQHRQQWNVDQLLRKKKEAEKEKKKRQQDGLLRLGMGAREKRGMAVISKAAVRGFQNSTGNRKK